MELGHKMEKTLIDNIACSSSIKKVEGDDFSNKTEVEQNNIFEVGNGTYKGEEESIPHPEHVENVADKHRVISHICMYIRLY